MTKPSDADRIEAALERDRAALASTVGALQKTVSVENISREALGLMRSTASASIRSIDAAVRANPLALGLAGAGLAWLIFGTRKAAKKPSAQANPRAGDAAGNAMPGDADPSDPTEAEQDATWSQDLDRLRHEASAQLHDIEQDASQISEADSDDLTNGATTTRDFATERSEVLAGFAEEMQKGFVAGLDDLSHGARDRIIAARERAYAATIRAENAIGRSGSKAGHLIEDHPMIAGAIAFALAAGFAAVLPRTKTEDRAFGAERDRLMAEAAELLRMANGMTDELTETAKTLQENLSEQVLETVKAVKGCVRDESAR